MSDARRAVREESGGSAQMYLWRGRDLCETLDISAGLKQQCDDAKVVLTDAVV